MIETDFLDAVRNKIKRIAKSVIENEVVFSGSAAMVFYSILFGSNATGRN